ncbi:hypothetical protein PLESTB_000518900 [Pleodorina starrii]|uniref:MYND-type domain-containing protein n=1 Tax=Pleodorina starrii TaxID=330485 RepID=A0A9W6BG97_9CHLO|nr:hypothetical protein PLESTB_000518900 [Pleodorina starrii]GLC72358.1 hypothetical protein PLESTF_001239200 [Pleodorina starrii]
MELQPRHITQREFRRFRCPCPDCANHFYFCPFRIDYEPGGNTTQIPFTCDPPWDSGPRQSTFQVDAEECARATRAYDHEYLSFLMSKTLGMELANKAKRNVQRFRSWFASQALSAAWHRALAAFGHCERDPDKAVRGAEEALVISPHCPDAHYLLARLKASSYEEALELFNRGTVNYEKLLSGEGWARCRQAYPHVAAAPPLHGAARCMVGAIQTLCRMRRGAEAYERMQALLQVTPPLRESLSEEVKVWEPAKDIWALAPEVVYRAKGASACLAWISEHFVDEVMEVGGAAVWWVATHALAWAETHQHEGFQWASLQLHEDEAAILGITRRGRSRGGNSGISGSNGGRDRRRAGGSSSSANINNNNNKVDGSSSSDDDDDGCCPISRRERQRRDMLAGRPRGAAEKLRSGMALALCCAWLPNLVDMLLGEMPLPAGPIPAMLVSSAASMGAQVAYVRYCGELWRSAPGVIDYVRRYRNTFEVFCIVSDARSGLKPSMKDFHRYMAPFPPEGAAAALPPPPAAAAASASNGGGGANGSAGSGSQGSLECSGSSGSAGSGSSSGSQLQAVGIFPDAILYEVYGCWHGLVETACSHHSLSMDATMNDQDLEILRTLLAAGCPLEASQRRPRGTPGPPHSPLGLAMHRGYGADAVRELLKAGADPLAPDVSSAVPLLSGAEQGMWRELQAVFKAHRKLGPSPPLSSLWYPFMARCPVDRIQVPIVPRTVFELLLEVAVGSECVPCVAGTLRGCTRCVGEDGEQHKVEGGGGGGAEGGESNHHSPWCNFYKVVEVLVAYGMSEVPEPYLVYMTLTADGSSPASRGPRRRLLEHLRGLLGNAAAARKAQQRKTTTMTTATATATITRASPTQQQQSQQSQQQGNGTSNGAAPEQKQQKQGGLPPPEKKPEQEQLAAAAAAAATGPSSASTKTEAQNGERPTAEAEAPPLSKPPQAVAGVEEAVAGASGTSVPGQPAAAAAAAASSPAACAAPAGRDRSRCCWACGKAKDRAAGVKLRLCSICCVARYCGDECQREHWPRHRLECQQLKEEAAAAAAAASDVAAAGEAAAGEAAGAKKKAKKKDKERTEAGVKV